MLNTDKPDEGAEILNAIARAFVEENNSKETERRSKRIKEYEGNLGKQEEELNQLRVQLRGLEKALKIPDEKIQKAQFDAIVQQQMQAAKAVADNRTDQIKSQEELTSARGNLQVDRSDEDSPGRNQRALRQGSGTQDLVLDAKKIDKEIIDTKTNGQERFVERQLEILNQKKQKPRQAND